MDWIRDNRRAATLLGAGAVLALVALLFLVLQQREPHRDTVIGGQPPAVVDPEAGLAGKSPKKKLPKKKAAKDSSRADAGPSAAGFPGLGPMEGLGDLGGPDGLAGGTLAQSLPTISIDITVTSSVPIGTIGYVIPTSKKSPSGRVDGVGTHWHLGTTGFGKPDYARVFFSAGPSGAPVTCTIRINGKITERRSTEGPYGQMMCQG